MVNPELLAPPRKNNHHWTTAEEVLTAQRYCITVSPNTVVDIFYSQSLHTSLNLLRGPITQFKQEIRWLNTDIQNLFSAQGHFFP